MITSIEIAEEFNDMFPDYSLARRIAQAFEYKAITRQETTITIPVTLQFSLPIMLTRPKESLKHKRLKQVAYNKLRELGETNPKIEYYYGGYFDLYAEKLGISVECGRTNLWSLWEFMHFSPQLDKEYWLLQYPQSTTSKLIRFFHTSKTKKFVQRIDKASMKRIAKALEDEAERMKV